MSDIRIFQFVERNIYFPKVDIEFASSAFTIFTSVAMVYCIGHSRYWEVETHPFWRKQKY